MQAFTHLSSLIIPLPYDSIDTDQIIPARYLKVIDKKGLAEGLFYGWRYRADGSPDPVFPLNLPVYQGRQILLAGDNFGCGSSREHAPWALMGWGIQAIISTSFADIFRNNALKNGLLPVQIDQESSVQLLELTRAEAAARADIARLADASHPLNEAAYQVSIDLPSQTLRLPGGYSTQFPIDPFSKNCLQQGVDQLGYLLGMEADIQRYESTARQVFSGVQPR
jgi:3-isopropylmalate/(R)-2-methylmalate dehydratase small subunit